MPWTNSPESAVKTASGLLDSMTAEIAKVVDERQAAFWSEMSDMTKRELTNAIEALNEKGDLQPLKIAAGHTEALLSGLVMHAAKEVGATRGAALRTVAHFAAQDLQDAANGVGHGR